MGHPASDLKGQQFGKLLAIEATEERNHNKTILWKCECLSCGKEVLVPSTKLKSSEKLSCGCQERVRSVRSEKGHTGFVNLVDKYKHAARKRGLDYQLSRDTFRKLVTSNCAYCGIPPSGVIYGSRGAAKEHGKFNYNGIDRVDNSLGYTVDNCVPCCKACNLAKHTRSSTEFLDWVRRVYEFTNA